MVSQTVIGIDIGGTNIKGSLFKNDEIIRSVTLPTLSKTNRKKVLDKIAQVIDFLLIPNVKGIGIGFPAPIIRDKIFHVPNISSLSNYDLVQWARIKYKLPISIANDADCFTLAHASSSAASKMRRVVGITLGTGIGIGVVDNKQIWQGVTGSVGELGKVSYQNGVLEQYVSNAFFIANTRKDAKTCYEKAMKNDMHSKLLFKEFGKHLGNAISIIINAYDPEVIVIGGKISKSYQLFFASMKKQVKLYTFDRTYNQVRIVVTKSEHSSEYGAACLIRQKLSQK